MKLPIHVEVQGYYNEMCGDNCPFLKRTLHGGLCLLFSDDVKKIDPIDSPATMFNRLSRCVAFDTNMEE